MPTNIVVFTSGTDDQTGSSLDGDYIQQGTLNGKPYYNLSGQPANSTVDAVSYDGSVWHLYGVGGYAEYDSSTGGATPDLTTGWMVNNANDFSGSANPVVIYPTGTVPNASVSGAGTSSANGTYVYAGFDGFQQPSWTLGVNTLVVEVGNDVAIYNGSGYLYIASQAAVPWDATGWSVTSPGVAPAPTVTMAVAGGGGVPVFFQSVLTGGMQELN